MREGESTTSRPGSPAAAEQPLLSRSANWAGEKRGATLGGWSRPSSGASTMEATDELYCLQGRTPPTMASFLGLYFDAAHSATWGPRPLQPLAQFVASVCHYAHVYDVLAFARAAGILPTHPSTTTTSLSRAPDRASRPNSPWISRRDSAAASSGEVSQQPGSDSSLRPSSAIPRARPSTAPAAQHPPRLSSSPRQQSFSHHSTTSASRQPPTSSSAVTAAAAAAPAAGPRLNISMSGHPNPAFHCGWEERGCKGKHPLLSRRQRQHHQGAAAAAATMLSLVPMPCTNAPPSSPATPQGRIKMRPGSAMPPSHPRLLSATTTSRAVHANRPATAGSTSHHTPGSDTGATSPLGCTQQPSATTWPAAPGAGVQKEGGVPVNLGDGSVNVGDGLQCGDSTPTQEDSSAPQPSAQSHSAMPPTTPASYLGQGSVDATANNQHVHMQHRVHSRAQQDLPRGVVVHRWQAPLPAEPLRCALLTPDVGVAMDALRAVSGAEDVAPELHALLQSTAVLLGVEVAPDLFLNPRLAEACPPPALPVALLHVPHVPTTSLTASAKKGSLLPRLKDGTFGWRRRAVLLMQPHLLQCFVQQQQQRQHQEREQTRRHLQKKQQQRQKQQQERQQQQQQQQQGVLERQESGEPPWDGSESAEEAEKVAEHGMLQPQQRQQLEEQEEWQEGDQGREENLGNKEQEEDNEEVEQEEGEEDGDGGPTPLYSPSEFQALLAMALAPMCMPGGGGWRLDMQRSSKASVTAGNAGVGPKGALAAADAITTAVLTDLAPEALQPHLPVQIRAKWAALYRCLVRTPMGCLTAGDRAALVCVGDLGVVVTAIYKSCVGCACAAECPDPTALLAEARLALRHRRASGTSSSSPIVDLSPESPKAADPIDLHELALLRVAALKRWASSSEGMQLMVARSEGVSHQ
ncbi:hypothetical protein DUNSADRAFT_6404 [Dunaliella salina]|uniref:Uncharacterized protein n=1 Tax=Dunaliella salina TaxID=3046 RepID=A0ABQ7H6S0_DUNSA|nr:hypothetical protein DUNSADRAFT_6404 [Dunaliella salina]|eukprot:KAF5842554.1 hypothetical protein DUNSADRAFT_6404 [Dunaliella salina]